MPLSALGPWQGAGTAVGGPSANSAVIDAHLAVQGTIRSYQVSHSEQEICERTSVLLTQVRGHLAAQIDPLGLNNMDKEAARKMIIRSVTVDEKV